MVTPKRLIRIEDALKVLTYATGAIGFLSVARSMPLFFSAGFTFFYIIALIIEYRNVRFIPRKLLTAISIIMITFFFGE